MTSALIIPTYNQEKELELVLESVCKLSKKPNMVVVADDGSTPKTSKIIKTYQPKCTVPIVHCWQEDKGFRKSKILNQAIAKANAEYIIQADGDCILHPNFVADHLNNAKNNQFLYGTRVRIKESYREQLFGSKKITFNPLSKGIKKRPRAIYCPSLNLYKASNKIPFQFRGANCSFYKHDFIKVNGYNEEFTGWGREDSELIIRFLNNQMLGRRLKFEAIVYHIDHFERDRDMLDINNKIELKTLQDQLTWCEKGVSQYL